MTKELNERLTDILRYHGINMDNTDLKARIMHCMEKAYALNRNEWVSVEERLPEYYQPILVYSLNTPSMGIAARVSNGDYSYYPEIGESNKIFTEVTHWMPLPKPPTDLLNR